MVEYGSIICIPSWAIQLPIGTRVRILGKLESIDPQRRLLILTYRNTSIPVDFSVVNQFQDFIGEVYEVYGTIEKKSGHDRSHCFALLVDIVQGADMKLIEDSLVIFNKTVRPEYLNIFI